MLHAKKSLGQHFLRNRRILEKIADAARLAPTDVVLEVGPGEGTLTELLLQKAEKVIAVEKDARLIPLLRHKFAAQITAGKLELIHADILNLDLRFKIYDLRFKIVANIPYYITGTFLRKFLQTERQPSSMTLLLQKEVAERIVAADGRESVLSISVKAYGEPRYIAAVKAGSFSPPPKVDSAIIAIENISKRFFEALRCHSRESGGPGKKEEKLDSCFRRNDNEERFFSLLKRGFSHPRKLLASNLGVSAETLEKCGIPRAARAENLSLTQWKCLTSIMRINESCPNSTNTTNQKGSVLIRRYS